MPASTVIPGLVSVILPVYNRERMLAEAVECVEAQTYRPIELIVVDDGSTDDTAGVCDRLAARKPSVIRVLHRTNGGPGVARETGRLAARGEFIQYLDSDDWIDPRKLETQTEVLARHPDAGICSCECREVWVDRPGVAALRPRSARRFDRIFPHFLSGRLWPTLVPLYRRSLSDRLGPWADLRQEEDLEYDARAGALGVGLVACPEILAEVRHHGEPRAGGHSLSDPARMQSRAASHQLVYAHARRAGVRHTDPNMQRYARELFLLSRQCGAMGLSKEARELFVLAREASGAERGRGLDFRAYGLAAATLGWTHVGRLACALDGLRDRSRRGA